MAVRECAMVMVAYLLGCVQTGYYLVRLRTGQDLRRLGSGATGARNTGRALGVWGFVVALLGDMAKGALAMTLATRFAVSAWAAPAALLAVAAGHIWPVQLRFAGGRGIAVGIGALAAWDLRLLGVLVAVTLSSWTFTRRFQASGLLGFVAVPVAAWWLRLPAESIVGLAGLTALVLYAHRGHVVRWLAVRADSGARPATERKPE